MKKFDVGLVVGKFAPLHKGHQAILERALEDCRHLLVMVYSVPDFTEMPQSLRASWIKTLYPEIEVFTPSGAPPDASDDFTNREFVKQYLKILGKRVDVVFAGEDYGPGFAAHLGVQYVHVDRSKRVPQVSGTAVRGDPIKFKEFLAPLVFQHFVRRVVFMGAESTGKTTIAKALAARHGACFMPEYGREYYEAMGGQLALDDYVKIANEHMSREDALAQKSDGILFVDTNAITTLYYSYYYNGDALPGLHDLADRCRGRYSDWFLCGDDIPFEQDGWRDTPELRSKMQRMIKMDLKTRSIGFLELLGGLDQRISYAERSLVHRNRTDWSTRL